MIDSTERASSQEKNVNNFILFTINRKEKGNMDNPLTRFLNKVNKRGHVALFIVDITKNNYPSK